MVATPIGNLGDITLRALDTLRRVDVIAAEDTRHTRKLLSHYDIHKPLTSYHSHNAPEKGRKILEMLGQGRQVALVTDAGTPGISDPGARIIQDAIEQGFAMVSIPGPTALIAGLVVSGLPTHPFAFLGFAPAKGSSRTRFFRDHGRLSMTLVLYESPQRLPRTLQDMRTCWGNRRAVVVRELTKKFEEITRGHLSELEEIFSGGVRGEITLIVEGATGEVEEVQTPTKSWEEELRELLLEEKLSVKTAVDQVASRHALSRKQVYRKALEIREARP